MMRIFLEQHDVASSVYPAPGQSIPLPQRCAVSSFLPQTPPITTVLLLSFSPQHVYTLKASATLTPSLSRFSWLVSVLIMPGLGSLASVHTDTRAERKRRWSRVKTAVAASWAVFKSEDWGRVMWQHPRLKGERGKVKGMGCRLLDLFAMTRFWAVYSEETKIDKCSGSTCTRTA